MSRLYPMMDLTAKIAVHSDASYANLPCGGSQGGYIIFVCDDMGVCAPISWASKKVKRVARSTLAAEALCAVDALDAAYLIGSIYRETMSETAGREIHLFTDIQPDV